MIKVAIELIANSDPDAARSGTLERARRFARYDDGHDLDFRAGPDTETVGAGFPPVDATWFHGVDVWTNGRKLHYWMTLLSEIRWVGTLTESWNGPALCASYTFDVTDPVKRSVELDSRDGATIVNKSYRLRAQENIEAMARIEATTFANAERRAGRAPRPDLTDLYPDVKALMEKREKKKQKRKERRSP